MAGRAQVNPLSLRDQCPGKRTSPRVDFGDDIEVGDLDWLMGRQYGFDKCRNVDEANLAAEKRFDRNFIGGAEHGWKGLAIDSGLSRQA